MGGLVARELIVKHKLPVKSVLFIASPLAGDSRIDLEVKRDLGGIIPGLNSHIAENALSDAEFVDHFFEAGFEPAAVGK
jgi:hypothetical protein